jgi:hypothetical protein
MKKIFVLFVLLSFNQIFSQSAVSVVDKPLEIDVVQQRPEFPGGDDAFMKFVVSNFQMPDADINGQLKISMVIGADGKVSNIKILKDLGEGTGAEAKRVLETCPKWNPGKQDDRNVPVVYVFPINLKTVQ